MIRTSDRPLAEFICEQIAEARNWILEEACIYNGSYSFEARFISKTPFIQSPPVTYRGKGDTLEAALENLAKLYNSA